MCLKFGGSALTPPPPPPLAPPPPPPAPPVQPLPEADPLITEVNPAVRAQQSEKTKNPNATGTQELRIPLDPKVNTGALASPAGGLNT